MAGCHIYIYTYIPNGIIYHRSKYITSSPGRNWNFSSTYIKWAVSDSTMIFKIDGSNFWIFVFSITKILSFMHDSHEPPWTHLLNCWKIPSPSVAALHPFFLRRAARQHRRGNFMGNFQMGHGTRSLWVISSLATQHISLEFCKTTASREKKPTVYSLSSGRLGCWIERTTLLLHSWRFPIPDLRECMGKWEKDSDSKAKLAGVHYII